MSLIFPKKEILYAPMLGTLGGGSSRGFGRGGGGKYRPSWTWDLNVTHLFRPALARGSLGPTYDMAASYYSGLPFISTTDDFDILGDGIQKLTIPTTGTYEITASGAYGGPGENQSDVSDAGGLPRIIKASGSFEAGTVLGLVVGQRGGEKGTNWSSSVGGGGGGGSWVFMWDDIPGDADHSDYYSTSALTPLIVAAGGNGSNWGSFSSETPSARGVNNLTQDPIPYKNTYNNEIGGRSAYGGSWSATPYFFTNRENWQNYDSQWSGRTIYSHANYADGRTYIYGAPALNSTGRLHTASFRGGLSLTAPDAGYHTNLDNRSQWSDQAGSHGGFGGGGGSKYEGGGGGGYWGGVPAGENDYNQDYSASPYFYGAESYVNHSLMTQSIDTLSTSANTAQRYTYYGTNPPPDVLTGYIQLRRIA